LRIENTNKRKVIEISIRLSSGLGNAIAILNTRFYFGFLLKDRLNMIRVK